MTGPLMIISSLADQGGPNDYAKELQVSVYPCEVASITWVNQGASAPYIQFFDLPFSPTATRAVTCALTVATLAAHRFNLGDQASIVGGSATVSGYVRPGPPAATDAPSATFTLHATLANAQNGVSSLDLSGVGAGPTVVITSPPIGEEYPCLAAASAPSNVGSLLNARFTRGCYVRAVTAVNGSTLIAAADIKFTPRYRNTSV